MATFTLTDLKNEVSKKYAPTIIENGKDKYTIQNLLQMPSKSRDNAMALIEELDNAPEESTGLDHQLAVFQNLIKEVTEGGKGEELLALLGDNDALLIELVTKWMETSQVGEAERS